MNLISHRVNTIKQLRETDTKFGVEVDIRSNGNDLIINHEPFSSGESFSDWIKEYDHGTLILNVKEEGLEGSLLDFMKDFDIDDFFFLDQSFPFLIKTVRSGESRCAVRMSEFESIETSIILGGKIDWVWVDCFTEFPLKNETFINLKDLGYKICIVSPELQGFDPEIEIPNFNKLFIEQNITPDAICTKRMDIWEKC